MASGTSWRNTSSKERRASRVWQDGMWTTGHFACQGGHGQALFSQGTGKRMEGKEAEAVSRYNSSRGLSIDRSRELELELKGSRSPEGCFTCCKGVL